MTRIACAVLLSALAGISLAQTGGTPPTLSKEQQAKLDKIRAREEADRKQSINDAVKDGVAVQISNLGGFRGARSNTIMGYGLVVGLEGTGDSKSIPVTSQAIANALTKWGSLVDANSFKSKNIAIVTVTAELPAFGAPGRKIDVTVQSIGDAKSLQGGTLLPTTLGTMWDAQVVYAVAGGPVSIGGFNVSSGGNAARKNHATVGRIPNGGDIQRSVDTKIVFENNTIFLDLDNPDFTTAQRTATKIQEACPEYVVTATDAVTISIQLPEGTGAVEAMSRIENLTVMAPSHATVVINERTGTIVIGGNVKLGPAVIAHGALSIRIDTDVLISQPGPLSSGTTVVERIPVVNAQENPTQIGVIAPNATLDDLARMLQSLNVSARDIIAILQALAEQGALKARIKIQ